LRCTPLTAGAAHGVQQFAVARGIGLGGLGHFRRHIGDAGGTRQRHAAHHGGAIGGLLSALCVRSGGDVGNFPTSLPIRPYCRDSFVIGADFSRDLPIALFRRLPQFAANDIADLLAG